MKTLFATSAIALAMTLGACSTAGLSEREEAAVATNAVMSEAMEAEIGKLNEITAIYIDAASLYKQAADIPDGEPGLKSILLDLAKERNASRELLQDRVIALGGDPREMGEALGTGHRTFTALRTIVDDDTEVAIEEVLRGEKYIVEEINEYMPLVKTADSRAILTQFKADAQRQIVLLEALDKAM